MEKPEAPSWVLLVYKIPREPTSSRAVIWRKLKRLGALLLHDAVWVLPAEVLRDTQRAEVLIHE